MGIDARDRLRRALGLRPARRRGRMDDLPVQVRERDDVVVDDSERPHPGAGEILQRGRAKPAGADDEDTSGLQLVLSRAADARSTIWRA